MPAGRCALLGGETAEHPGTMPDDAFDLAGFCIGAVDEASLLGAATCDWATCWSAWPRVGCTRTASRSCATPSSTARARRRAARAGRTHDRRRAVGAVRDLCARRARTRAGWSGAGRRAHHGGGVHENLPRSLPDGLGARIDRGSWPEPIVGLVRDAAGATDEDMFGTFNMGLGMVLAVDPRHADEVLARSGAAAAYRIGAVVEGAGVRIA